MTISIVFLVLLDEALGPIIVDVIAFAISFAIGGAVAGTIGGFVMISLIRKAK